MAKIRKLTRPNGEQPETAKLFGRRRRDADDFEPIVSFAVLRKLRNREHRELRREVEGDRFLRRALTAKIISRMEEEGVDVDAESDTPILDWIRDNWGFIMQAIKDLIGLFGGGGAPV